MRVEESVVVERPPAEVFATLADLEGSPRWQPTLERVELETEGPVGIGTRGVERRRLHGRSVESRFEVLELEPERRLSLRTSTAGIDATGTFTCGAAGEGTRVDFELEMAIGRASRLMQPVLRRMVAGETRANLNGLKQLLESE